MDTSDIFPYRVPDNAHRLAWVFVNANGISMPVELCSALAEHVFDNLGCGEPGTVFDSKIKYDSIDGSPLSPGRWIPADSERQWNVSEADNALRSMTPEQREALRVALQNYKE